MLHQFFVMNFPQKTTSLLILSLASQSKLALPHLHSVLQHSTRLKPNFLSCYILALMPTTITNNFPHSIIQFLHLDPESKPGTILTKPWSCGLDSIQHQWISWSPRSSFCVLLSNLFIHQKARNTVRQHVVWHSRGVPSPMQAVNGISIA